MAGTSCITSVASLRIKEPDFIVVGGGITGLVVASRLSEDADKSVLVIEAGASRIGDPRIDDWQSMTVATQTHVNGRQIPQVRGKFLSGSSAINFSATVYPSKGNFNVWNALGNDGWSGDDMQQNFRKFEHYIPATQHTKELLSMNCINEKVHVRDGPLPVTVGDAHGPFNEAWAEIMKNLGWSNRDDPIEGEKLDAFACGLSLDPKTEMRACSASAYYNAEVLTKDGKHHNVSAKREVILAAGPLQSPQLLELSGIGQSKVFKEYGIPVIDSPGVGENLQDHAICATRLEVADDQISGDVMQNMDVVQRLLKQDQETQTGPFAGMPISIAQFLMVHTEGAASRDDIEQFFREYLEDPNPNPPAYQKKQYELLSHQLADPKESTGVCLYLPFQLHASFVTIMAVINHHSRVVLSTSNRRIRRTSLYDPRYLPHPLDLEIMVKHMQYMEKMYSRLPEGYDATTMEGARKVVKERLLSSSHPTDTCAMMPKELMV
ncbi:GMC oxidoreductase [Aplosporella prunicola CBS 121167]|uniref:GMC oxidoreductase n=1 Tax=Aplosporella prunicola CBS 121167 TaxID=1176127 RepID=A0A6A6BEL7_9PEZI|nr:GMC oxidoreductase [Aplosporella prunicola CBS 121167]KAF2141714.1 GMC oxidoreductase [Aplosporella prunicola CBS 121167]